MKRGIKTLTFTSGETEAGRKNWNCMQQITGRPGNGSSGVHLPPLTIRQCPLLHSCPPPLVSLQSCGILSHSAAELYLFVSFPVSLSQLPVSLSCHWFPIYRMEWKWDWTACILLKRWKIRAAVALDLSCLLCGLQATHSLQKVQLQSMGPADVAARATVLARDECHPLTLPPDTFGVFGCYWQLKSAPREEGEQLQGSTLCYRDAPVQWLWQLHWQAAILPQEVSSLEVQVWPNELETYALDQCFSIF